MGGNVTTAIGQGECRSLTEGVAWGQTVPLLLEGKFNDLYAIRNLKNDSYARRHKSKYNSIKQSCI